MPLDILKSADAGGYEDLPLSCTNSDTRDLALQSGPWPRALVWVFREVQPCVLEFYLSPDMNPYCITLYHPGVCKRSGACFGGWVAVSRSHLYPNTQVQSISKGLCFVCQCEWVRWIGEKPWGSVIFCYVPFPLLCGVCRMSCGGMRL